MPLLYYILNRNEDMFTMTLSVKVLETPKCPSTIEWINKCGKKWNTEYYIAMKMNECMLPVAGNNMDKSYNVR